MKNLILFLSIGLLLGCNEATQDLAANSAAQDSLTVQEQQQQEEFQVESKQTEAELNDAADELTEMGINEESEVEQELSIHPGPFYYPWYKRLANRLLNLQDILHKVYRAYHALPQRLQNIIKPWLQSHLKHTYARLDRLKDRLIYYYRTSFDQRYCIMVDRPMGDVTTDAALTHSSTVDISTDAVADVRIDEDGVRYVESDSTSVRPYICVPTTDGLCRDYCSDNIHLVKRLVHLIEEIQQEILKFVRSMD